jgi:hypothetical protein
MLILQPRALEGCDPTGLFGSTSGGKDREPMLAADRSAILYLSLTRPSFKTDSQLVLWAFANFFVYIKSV